AFRRDVARHGESALADFPRQRLSALAVAHVHRDRGAALVQARCGSLSEAAPRTSDDGDAPCKISVFHRSSPFLSSRAKSRDLLTIPMLLPVSHNSVPPRSPTTFTPAPSIRHSFVINAVRLGRIRHSNSTFAVDVR